MCLLYLHLQNGTEPIHLATIAGHLDVVTTLIERCDVDPQETTNVRAWP